MLNIYRKGCFRRIFISSLFLSLSVTSSAIAASSVWERPYLGFYMGGGFANNHASSNAGSVTDTSYFTDPANLAAVNDAGASIERPGSLIGGIEAGHDWMWNQMVYGVVLDYGALPLNSSAKSNNLTYPDNSGQYSVATAISTNWLFTLRGRVGYATTTWAPSLFYFTTGPALTQLRISNSFSDTSAPAGVGSSKSFQNQIGWATGVGFEVASFSHFSLSLEYLYLFMPSFRTTSYISNTQGGFGFDPQSTTSAYMTTGRFHANLIKLGLNYKFDE